jgi:hypothetical protein
MSILNDYIDEAEAASQLRKCQRVLQIWRQRRQGPAWTKIGKTVVYRRTAILEWLKSQEQQPVRSRRATAA